MNFDKILDAINMMNIKYLKSNFPDFIKNANDPVIIKDIIIRLIKTYTVIKNTSKYDFFLVFACAHYNHKRRIIRNP